MFCKIVAKIRHNTSFEKLFDLKISLNFISFKYIINCILVYNLNCNTYIQKIANQVINILVIFQYSLHAFNDQQ